MLLFEWMARAVVLAALIGVAAWALEAALRGWKRATRYVWVLGLLLSIGLPSTALFAPDLWPEALKRSGGVIVLPAVQPVMAEGVAASATVMRRGWSARDFALGLWFSASLLLTLRWLHGWQKLWAVRSRWREAILAGERVLISDRFGPAVVGLRSPRVVIPSWLLIGDAERQRMIVRHEMEHARAGDPWLLALAPILLALFPWNPALWWQLQRLRIAVELDCDARVLRGGVPALEYGSMLLDVAGGTSVLQPTLAALSEPRTSLERRIRAMTPTRYRHALVRAASFTALSALTLAGAIVAGAPTAPPLVAQERRTPVTQQQEGRLLIVLDGKLLPPTAKLDLANREINAIEVLDPADALKKFGQRGRFGAVVLTTRPRNEVTRPTAATADVAAAREDLKAQVARLLLQQQTRDLEKQLEPPGPRGTIEGEVTLGERGPPAVNAQVTIGSRNAVTDDLGRFIIADVPVGAHTVDVRMKGYIGSYPVVVTANTSTTVPTMRLSAMTEIERTKFENAAPLDNNAAEIQKLIGARIRLRGLSNDLSNDRPLIIIDGVRIEPGKRIIIDGVVYDPGDKLLPLLDPSLIESVEVVKGPAAVAQYGEHAANGVIVITTKRR